MQQMHSTATSELLLPSTDSGICIVFALRLGISLLLLTGALMGTPADLMAETRPEKDYHARTAPIDPSEEEKQLLDGIRHQFGMAGSELPTPDSGLMIVAREEARRLTPSNTGAGEGLDQSRLRHVLREQGISDYHVRGSISSDTSFESLSNRLFQWAQKIHGNKHNRFGVGIETSGNQKTAVVIMSRRIVYLDAIPKHLPQTRELVITGFVAIPGKPSIYITTPNGLVLSAHPRRISSGAFSQAVNFNREGEYTLEVLVDGRDGPQVAAILAMCVNSCDQARKPPPFRPPASPGIKEQRKSILSWTNTFRAQYQLKPLLPESSLDKLEQSMMDSQQEDLPLLHRDDRGLGPKERLEAAKIGFLDFGENLGRNAALGDLLYRLATSPAHRRNLLSPVFTHMGIGIRHSPEKNLWTIGQLFTYQAGRRMPRVQMVEALPLSFWKAVNGIRQERNLRPIHHLGRLVKQARAALRAHSRKGSLDTEQLRRQLQTQFQRNPNSLVRMVAVVEVADYRQLANFSGFQQAKWNLAGVAVAERQPQGLVALVLLGQGKPH